MTSDIGIANRLTTYRRVGRGLARDRRGVTAVEFAFIATPLMALLIAIVQVSTTFFAQQTIETAAEKGARLLMTGQAQKSGMSAADFKSAICTQLPSFMKCANLMVDVNVANDFDDVSTNAPTITYDASGNPNNATAYKTGNPGDIVIMKTMYVWDVNAGPLGFDISTMSKNRKLLLATSVFKSENY